MATNVKLSKNRIVRDDYLDLIRVFPLRKIRNRSEHGRAVKVMAPLIVRATKEPAALSHGETDYLEALAVLVDAFEKPLREKIIAALTPLDRIRHYMEVRKLKPKDLAEHVGGKAAASLILSGKRQVSREQAKSLAALFSVDAGKFL